MNNNILSLSENLVKTPSTQDGSLMGPGRPLQTVATEGYTIK